MENEAFAQYVKDRYEGQMSYYKVANRKNQKKYKQFQWILIVLSALTPVLAALDLSVEPDTSGTKETAVLNWGFLKYGVVVISAFVAILTTGLKTFQYQELWITYRATYEQLKPEIHYYNFGVGPYGEEGINKESLFINRIETILDKEHQGWPPAKKLMEERKKDDDEVSSPNSESTTI